ncbi:MAG: SPFH domain-containing protein [Candidatus Pacebacteria bacterium]|nr:SPFH domain-containing protein [Candidatus Paceibacterota bacterium]
MLVLGGVFLLLRMWIPGMLLILVALAILWKGIVVVGEEHRIVVECLGSYWDTLEPGFHWIVPILMRIRGDVLTSAYDIPLFWKRYPIIDFKDGSATLVDCHGVVQLLREKSEDSEGPTEEDPSIPKDIHPDAAYRVFYNAGNQWMTLVANKLENMVRSYLNSLTLDEALMGGRGGFNLLNSILSIPDDEPDETKRRAKDEINSVKDQLAMWGWEIVSVFVEDFDLPREIADARNRLQVAEKEKRIAEIESETAEFRRLIAARETAGVFAEMVKIIKRSNKDLSEDEVRRVAEELTTRMMSLDRKALIDVRGTQGGIEQIIFQVIQALRGTGS